jgi:hypothetical protein
VDGVFGLAGKAQLSQRWFITGKADLGGGGSNFTYQLFGGVGVNVGKRYALIGGYRDLFVTYYGHSVLYHNERNGTFKDVAVEAGVAFSAEGRARAGMGADSGDFDNSGRPGLAVTNFDNEMIGLYRSPGRGLYEDVATRAGIGIPSRNTLGFGCGFLDVDLDGRLDLVVANGHIEETVRNIRGNIGYAQPPHLFLNQGDGTFRDVATAAGGDFAQPKVGRGLAFGDFDRDGDVDLLMTTNNGPAVLFRNDQLAGRKAIRFRLVGTQSNRDAIGARITWSAGGVTRSRLKTGGGSYLSSHDPREVLGLGPTTTLDWVEIKWPPPSGRTERFTNVPIDRYSKVVEGRGRIE